MTSTPNTDPQQTAHSAYSYLGMAKTRQTTYVQRNIVARSRNHCYNRKATLHSMCVVALHVATAT